MYVSMKNLNSLLTRAGFFGSFLKYQKENYAELSILLNIHNNIV